MDSSPTQQPAGGIELLTWLEVHKKQLLLGAAIAVVLSAGITIYRYAHAEREASASEALSELRLPLGVQSRTPAVSADKYLKLAQEKAGTAAGPRALLLGAGALFTEGRYAEAQQKFVQFLRDNPNHPLVPQAALGVAASLDAEHKPEAATKYQEVVARYSTDLSVVNPAKLALARLAEARRDYAQANTIYQELVRGESYSSWAEEAMIRKAALEKEHPELAMMPPATQPKLPMPMTFNTNRPIPRTNVVRPSLSATNVAKPPTVKLLSATNPPALSPKPAPPTAPPPKPSP